MTKEKLERIKQAYNSGLKVQIWFNGYWEDFDVRDYSMYSEPFSENRQYRIVGSDYADISEKRIADLEKENAELKSKNKWYSEQVCNKECAEVWGNLTKATEIIRQFLNDYPVITKELLDKLEQFIKEIEK